MPSARVNAERDAIAARALAAAAAGKACATDAPDPQGEAMDDKMKRWASHYGSFDRRVVQGLICVAAELTVLDAGTVTKLSPLWFETDRRSFQWNEVGTRWNGVCG